MGSSLDQRVGGALWRLIVGSVSAIAILIGGIAWANSVDANAKHALKIGEENKAELKAQREQFSAELKALREQLARQDNNMTELRVDMRYLINAVNDLKQGAK